MAVSTIFVLQWIRSFILVLLIAILFILNGFGPFFAETFYALTFEAIMPIKLNPIALSHKADYLQGKKDFLDNPVVSFRR